MTDYLAFELKHNATVDEHILYRLFTSYASY